MPAPNGPVKSLYQLAKNVLVKHVDTIDDVGDLDYHLLRPVLLKITSPVQLKKLERNSPQIAAESKEIWLKLIIRDFGQDAPSKYPPPSPPHSYSRLYEKHQKAAAAASAIASSALKAKMTALTSAKSSARARIITNTAGLPPTQRKRGDGSGWGRSAESWTTKAGSKTKNIVAKARKEAKELSVFRGRNSRLAAPTHTLKRAEVSRSLKEKIKDPGIMPEVALPTTTEERKRGREGEMGEDGEEEEEQGRQKRRVEETKAKWLSGGRVATGKLNTGGAGPAGAPKVRAEADPFMRRKPVAGAQRRG